MSEYAINVKNVCVNYRLVRSTAHSFKEWFVQIGKTKVQHEIFNALKDVTFSVEKGERVGIVGRNGAGKSTLLKTISGIITPTSGELQSHGRITPLLELGAGFDFELTGTENIFLNGAILGLTGKMIKEKYSEIVEFSELGDFINQPLRNYSSGMVTRLAFSIATITKPEILIIDEVLSVGDGAFQNKSKNKMIDLINDRTTVLFVSHDITQVKQICNRAIWLENGEVKEFGESEDVCNHYAETLAG